MEYLAKFRSVNRLKTIGWREWVSLPELGISRIKVKVDSGAQISALHAFDITFFEKEGQKMVRFWTTPNRKNALGKRPITARLDEKRYVKSSTGTRTLRPMITTKLQIGTQDYSIQLSLINRDLMGYRMLLGRQAIENRFLVDAGQSFLLQ